MPFANSAERADHFHKHGVDFGAKNARDYEAKADAFLLGPKSSTALDYTRSQGDLVRFDPATDEFGVLSASGEVRTYFRPVPGVTHKRSTNLEYFNVSCLMRF
jgi:filamentous hemagglutinin